ncbi:MAG: hypothetical protein ACRDWI_08605 [Jiangellaceae bacterium]
METTSGFAALPLYRKIALGAAVLLFIDLFLPWLSVSFFDESVTANAWDSGLGTFAGILLIALIVWEVLRLTGNAPEFGVKHDLVTAGLAVLIALFTLILFFDVLGDTGIGAWIGLVLLLALGYAAFLAFTAGGGREMLSQAQGRDQAPASPTATTEPPDDRPVVDTPPVVDEPVAEAPPAPPRPDDPPRV